MVAASPDRREPKVNIAFPIETLNRELDWRLLLAGMHAGPSNRIFIGQHDVLYRMIIRTGMQGGVYVGKHLFCQLPALKDYRRYQAIKDQGFLLVHLDEEGGVYEGDEDRWRHWLLTLRFDPRCLRAEDYVCTWGEFQRDVYRSVRPACGERIHATGHPRFELYKAAYRTYFERDASALRDRFGDFILVNTNVGFANNQLGLADTFSPRMVGYGEHNPVERLAVVDRYAHELLLIGAMVRLINRLSMAHPRVNIVVRPHPAEDVGYYRTIFGGISNVHVVHEGPVTPWLMACRLLLHTGCTTAMEAYLAGRPIINFKPGIDPSQELFLAQIFGVTCDSEDDVMACVEDIVRRGAGEPPPAELDGRARSLIANFDRDCADAFLRVVDEAEAQQRHVPQTWAAWRTRRTELGRVFFVERPKSLVRPLFPAKQRRYAALRTHFVQLDRELIMRRIRTIEAMFDKRFAVTFFSDQLLSIESVD